MQRRGDFLAGHRNVKIRLVADDGAVPILTHLDVVGVPGEVVQQARGDRAQVLVSRERLAERRDELKVLGMKLTGRGQVCGDQRGEAAPLDGADGFGVRSDRDQSILSLGHPAAPASSSPESLAASDVRVFTQPQWKPYIARPPESRLR